MPYRVYLGGVLLPVSPGKLDLKIQNNNKTVTLINDGEINILKTPGLTDIVTDILLPGVPYSFASYTSGFRLPEYYLAHFEKLKAEKQKPQFIVTRTFPNGKPLHGTNMTVSVEEYTITDDAKEGFDTIVSLKLKQWRNYGVKTVNLVTPATPTVTRLVTTGDFKVGSIVYFFGKDHYYHSNAAAPNNPKGGLKATYAKITQTNPGSKHPWHLIYTKGGGGFVYGWVDTGTFR